MTLLSVAQSVRAAVRLKPRRSRGRLEQLHHVLPNLRAADPSVSGELAEGSIGLPSGVLAFGNRDMFTVALEDPVKARDLFAFSWLRHLDAARTEASETQIRTALMDWARHAARRSDIACEPAVRARRALNLLAHADASLPGASPVEFDAIMDLVAGELADLAREAKRMPVSQARMTAHVALLAFALVSGHQDIQIADAERRLAAELLRQLHADGGHVSRNPMVVLDAALDLAPLKQLYLTCRRPVPVALTDALTRLSAMLRLLQMPDHSLGRFNGMGATSSGDLLTVLRLLCPGAAPAETSHAADTGWGKNRGSAYHRRCR